jgi:predicted transcriptional regulator
MERNPEMEKKSEAEDLSEQVRLLSEAVEDIRRLLIYGLIRNGASQGQVATALGTTQATVSRLLSAAKKSPKRRK